jgi:hypothetical protein
MRTSKVRQTSTKVLGGLTFSPANGRLWWNRKNS